MSQPSHALRDSKNRVFLTSSRVRRFCRNQGLTGPIHLSIKPSKREAIHESNEPNNFNRYRDGLSRIVFQWPVCSLKPRTDTTTLLPPSFHCQRGPIHR